MSAKRKVTLGDILDLMDIHREGGVEIIVVGPDNEAGVSGFTDSEIWTPWLDWPVDSIGTEEGTEEITVWLAEKEADHDPE